MSNESKSYGEVYESRYFELKDGPARATSEEANEGAARAVLLRFIAEVRSHPLFEVRPEQAFDAIASRIEQGGKEGE